MKSGLRIYLITPFECCSVVKCDGNGGRWLDVEVAAGFFRSYNCGRIDLPVDVSYFNCCADVKHRGGQTHCRGLVDYA